MGLLETNTFQGFAQGSFLGQPPHALPDDAARYIQDALVYRENETLRRGPVRDVTGIATFSYKAVGFAFARDPLGNNRAAVLNGDGSHALLSILSADYTSKTDISLGGGLSLSPYTIVNVNPMFNGGALIGLSTDYTQGPSRQDLIIWRGGIKADYSTGTITAAFNNKVVTGSGTSWLSNLSAGMFLMDAGSPEQYIGTIVSVDSNTQVTLEEAPLTTRTAQAYRATSVRGWGVRVTTGGLTSSTANVNVTGANTKFIDEGLSSGWKIFRASDMSFVGSVSAVTSNLTLTLTANAAISLANDDYVAVSNTTDYGFSLLDKTKKKPGFISASYAGLQMFGNRGIAGDGSGEFVNRLTFTDSQNPEEMDMSVDDGNFIPITSSTGSNTPITALVSASNSLVILKESETFVLVGKNVNQFEVRKLIDDGTIGGMSAVPYNGGAVWAGRNGIYMYDGVAAENVTDETLGAYYSKALASFDSKFHRMYGFIYRDHYILYIEHVSPPDPIIKGTAISYPTNYAICMHLPTRAITFLTNMNMRGGAIVPGSNAQNAWFIANSSTVGHVCDMAAIFDEDGNDMFACDGGTAGPDFYIESKKFDAGDGLLKKLWKQIMFHYLVGGDSLRLDTILGLNEVGSQRPTGFPISIYTWDNIKDMYPSWNALASLYPTFNSLIENIFLVRRIKFIKRSQYFSFRLYQNSSAVTKVKLGPFSLAYKKQRPGRV